MSVKAHRAFHAIGTFLKVTLGLLVGLIVLGIVITAINFGSAVQKSNTVSHRATQNMSLVHVGNSESQVRRSIGNPEDSQKFNSNAGVEEYWYYGLLTTDKTYQLVFDDGVLTAINTY